VTVIFRLLCNKNMNDLVKMCFVVFLERTVVVCYSEKRFE